MLTITTTTTRRTAAAHFPNANKSKKKKPTEALGRSCGVVVKGIECKYFLSDWEICGKYLCTYICTQSYVYIHMYVSIYVLVCLSMHLNVVCDDCNHATCKPDFNFIQIYVSMWVCKCICMYLLTVVVNVQNAITNSSHSLFAFFMCVHTYIHYVLVENVLSIEWRWQ